MRVDSSNYFFITNLSQSSQNNLSRKPLGIERSSGHICPESGYWELTNPASKVVISVKKGETMPFQQGTPVSWQLIKYDLYLEQDN